MKSIILALLFLCTFSPTSFAQVETPKMFSIQAVLIDGGGNVLYDLQETDINFKIIDGGGNVYYEEVQHVYMVNGAMSTLIGRGVDPSTGQPTGGIPYEALEPDADRLIRFKLVDHTVPQEDMQIVSVPYAYYSEFADTLMEPLIGDLIANEAITLAHVSPELKNYIDNATDGISKQDLQDHITNDKAHDAKDIVVSTPLKYSGGNTVDKALHEFDMVLEIWANKDGLFEKDITNITNKITGLEDGTTLDPRYVNVTGDTMTGNLDMGNNNITNINQLTATTLVGDGGGITNISGTNVQEGTIASQQIKDGSIATGDLANTNISQWTNDSKYITDGNTNWENDYEFITTKDLPDFSKWDTNGSDDLTNATKFGGDVSGTYDNLQIGSQSVGSAEIADGTIDYDDLSILDFAKLDLDATDDLTKTTPFGEKGGDVTGTYDLLEVSLTPDEVGAASANHDHDEDYVNVTGDTMTGNIAMNDAACNANNGPQDPKNCRVDGVDVSELEVMVKQIQKEDEAQPAIIAWLRTLLVSNIPIDGNCYSQVGQMTIIQNDFNIDCIVREAKGVYQIHFIENPVAGNDTGLTTNYIVVGNAWINNAVFPGGDIVSILETRVGYFRIKVQEVGAGPQSGSDSDFMVQVIK